jgi:hypothetical protein
VVSQAEHCAVSSVLYVFNTSRLGPRLRADEISLLDQLGPVNVLDGHELPRVADGLSRFLRRRHGLALRRSAGELPLMYQSGVHLITSI